MPPSGMGGIFSEADSSLRSCRSATGVMQPAEGGADTIPGVVNEPTTLPVSGVDEQPDAGDNGGCQRSMMSSTIRPTGISQLGLLPEEQEENALLLQDVGASFRCVPSKVKVSLASVLRSGFVLSKTEILGP